jgi:hypothetical protein
VRQARNAQQARFASRYYRNHHRWHVAYRPYRWAWRHNWYVGFTPWYGPVFWPYAYADIFAYTFWPYGYAPGYWAYAYDDFFDGVFWGYGAPSYGYAYASAPQSSSTRVTRKRTSTEVNVASAQELCKQPGDGITAWPFEEITDKVNLNDEQVRLLDEVKASAKDAAAQFAKSCPQDPNFAATPPSRLDAMTARLFATLQAVQTVRPSLERFYASLSDDQKEAFNQIGPNEKKIAANSQARAETQGSAVHDQQAANCGEQKSGLALPIDRIAKAVKPNDEQQKQLHELETATGNAVGILQQACPDQVALTPPGRLEAMETRLKAMVEAANTVKPALDTFYASLSDEQKAHFNKLGRDMRASSK